jgi:hypothetical protein
LKSAGHRKKSSAFIRFLRLLCASRAPAPRQRLADDRRLHQAASGIVTDTTNGSTQKTSGIFSVSACLSLLSALCVLSE